MTGYKSDRSGRRSPVKTTVTEDLAAYMCKYADETGGRPHVIVLDTPSLNATLELLHLCTERGCAAKVTVLEHDPDNHRVQRQAARHIPGGCVQLICGKLEDAVLGLPHAFYWWDLETQDVPDPVVRWCAGNPHFGVIQVTARGRESFAVRYARLQQRLPSISLVTGYRTPQSNTTMMILTVEGHGTWVDEVEFGVRCIRLIGLQHIQVYSWGFPKQPTLMKLRAARWVGPELMTVTTDNGSTFTARVEGPPAQCKPTAVTSKFARKASAKRVLRMMRVAISQGSTKQGRAAVQRLQAILPDWFERAL